MNKTLRLRGSAEPTLAAPPATAEIGVLPKGRVRLAAAARGAGEVVELADVAPDDLACLEYANGFKLWLRVDQLYQEHGAAGTRAADAQVWEIDPRPPAGEERGAAGAALEALEVFGVDLKGLAARALAQRFEQKQLGRPPGLYHCSLEAPLGLAPLDGVPAAGAPLLLFIHGTASSCAGSFGRLWDEGNREGREVRRRLGEIYGDGVYAFEHWSLTSSPIANALELARRLPEGAELHLVTHSRGGLVGELLCLGSRNPEALDGVTLDRLFAKDRTMVELFVLGRREPAEYAAERVLMDELLQVLDAKGLRITRFVRAACPARGTTLASGRLDRWLSVLKFLAAETLVDDALDFLLGVVKERTDPRSLPGLEAMMPGSALVRLLNRPQLAVAADLSVIAGDVEGDSLWGRLKWLVADWFYAGDHDLVVNTGSMYGGARRAPGGARFVFDQGKDVNHFNYFANARTVRMLLAGLTRAEGAADGFLPIEEARHEEPAWRSAVARSATQGPRPLALVLPGIMGSGLAAGGERVWLDHLGLSQGKLARLAIGADDVAPLDLLDEYYGDLLVYLARSHRVVPFPYDWRRSVVTNAGLLAQTLEQLLPECEAAHQPIHIVAHSMGGLVWRALMALHRRTWERIRALDGSRLLMLGTPNGGSLEALRWITGWNPTFGALCLLDGQHDRNELLEIVTRYPGLLELLPSAGPRDFADAALWQTLRSQAQDDWPLPEEGDLAAARDTWQTIAASPIDRERMIYVAGWAPRTVGDFEVFTPPAPPDDFTLQRPVLRFRATSQGDGTVTWESGLLPGVATWYVAEAGHDELPSHEAAFPAYLDLMQTGTTSRLSQEPPRSRAAMEEPAFMPARLPDSQPGPEDLASFVFGEGRPRRQRPRRRLPLVSLTLRHGDLAYARHPVCVGHYQGDTIVSAEAELDRRLEGALRRRASLDLYPGPLGTQEVFINLDPHARPGGALVVGLGPVGELSPGALEAGIARAALEYALAVAEWPDERFGPAGAPRCARLSCLLIGTGFGSLTVRDSIEAVLRGVKAANLRLLDAGLDNRVLLDEIKLLELYQDLAIQAARALDSILLDGELAGDFQWRPRQVLEGQGGRRRVLFQEAPNWWQRLEIKYDAERGELRFISLTNRARAEETLVAGQLRLAEDFVAIARGSASHDREVSRTLFEMLLPNRLKELAPEQRDVVLLVDEVSASFPWELLEDRWGGGRPPAVAGGMLRQLKTPSFRPRPAHPLGDGAYVVGNPQLPPGSGGMQFPGLPGAEREAREVEALLRRHGYQVRADVNAVAQDILMGLHAAGWRILHFAGHGVHDLEMSDGKRISGMVIGDNVVLTPGDVEQMRWVPELVFINCCHLGATRSLRPEWSRYNALAANLAIQFINMGVKAVVAAGWAVDDAAALDFARSFYRHMLAGDGFGEAVRAAREEIHGRHAHVNTWGAYQCYGDPDFRLTQAEPGGAAVHAPFHAPAELVAELDNLAGEARMRGAREGDDRTWLPLIDRLLERVPAGERDTWLARADVCAALGIAYGELGELDGAIAWLDRAVAANRAEFSLRAVEQRANFQLRRALQAWLAGRKRGGAGRPDPVAEVNTAVAQLQALTTMAETVERLSLLGSAYKWLAWMRRDRDGTVDALGRMADSYRRAFERSDAEGRADSYPLVNWLAAEAALAWYGAGAHDKKWQGRMTRHCERASLEAARRDRLDPEFWTGIAEPDCRLARALLAGDLAEQAPEIAAGYRRAVERGASIKQRDAIAEHLDFLAAVATRAGKQDVARTLAGLRRQL
ncbi:MAG: DUF7379 domain-containing protein [Pseudomonadota bacterium]